MSSADSTGDASRRKLLKAIGTASVAGLAGCGGGGGGNDGSGGGSSGGGSSGDTAGGSSDQELGERVPTVVMSYWSDYGAFTTIQENMAAPTKEQLESALGISFENKPLQIATAIGNAVNDRRTEHIMHFWSVNNMYRLDPIEPMSWWYGFRAGANGLSNYGNYASCEYTKYATQAAQATSKEERREMYNEAQRVMSEDSAIIALTPNLQLGAYNQNEVELGGVNNAGLLRANNNVFAKSSSKTGKDQLIAGVGPTQVETRNFMTLQGANPISVWARLIHTPLLNYNEDFELVPAFAQSLPEIENEFQRFTFELKDGTFHNGDPVTAEDVKFTFEQMIRGSKAGVYTKPLRVPYDSINVIDEKTIEFNMTEPFPPFDTGVVPRWGILHKESWVDGGAVDSPGSFQFSSMVGSGPFKIDDFQQGSYMSTVPHEGNPWQVPDVGIYWKAYRNTQTTFQALANNEIQLMPEISPGILQRVESNDALSGYSAPGHLGFDMRPQQSFGPGKFKAFRQAMSAAINRQELSNVAYRGQANPELYATPLTESHPWRAPEEMLYKQAPPEGDPEKARQILEDAGWGWDDQGRLHYPPDADLSPRWPEGETPLDVEEFQCLEEYAPDSMLD